MNKIKILKNLHERHVKGTTKEDIVLDERVLLCHLTNTVSKQLNTGENSVYVNTRVIKHLYDKRPAEEYDFIIDNSHKIIKYPDEIYKNKNPKRGDYCFVKKIKEKKYLSSLEISNGEILLVTVFRLNKESYLNDYELLWRWRDGEPSS